MTYVNQFLISKAIPMDIVKQINQYLHFLWESKKTMKIEEDEVMNLLNGDLRNKITVYLNG